MKVCINCGSSLEELEKCYKEDGLRTDGFYPYCPDCIKSEDKFINGKKVHPGEYYIQKAMIFFPYYGNEKSQLVRKKLTDALFTAQEVK